MLTFFSLDDIIYLSVSLEKSLTVKGKSMKFKIDHDYHLHSYLSPCGNCPEQTTASILEYAKKNKLEKICLTDHYWDSLVPTTDAGYKNSHFGHISQALPLPQDKDVTFYFGCEGEMDKDFNVSVPPQRYNDFDFILIPTTHLHCVGVTIAEEYATDEQMKAKIWVERIDRLLDQDLPFHKLGIPHLATSLIHNVSREGFFRVLDAIPTSELERVFTRVAAAGCGIELNRDDFCFFENEKDSVLRIFKVAKGCGCKFFLGSDAHTPVPYRYVISVFERAINLLDLTESDKFHFN